MFVAAAQAMRRVAKLRPANLATFLAEQEDSTRLLEALVHLLEVMLADADLAADPSDMITCVVDILCGAVLAVDVSVSTLAVSLVRTAVALFPYQGLPLSGWRRFQA